MPSPCTLSETRIVYDAKDATLHLGAKWCPFLNRICKPAGCVFAADPKYQPKGKTNE